MWLDAGVRLVWVVYPARREIVIHRADSATTLTETDTPKGEDVVPASNFLSTTSLAARRRELTPPCLAVK
jgi:hypothetical protein